MTMIESLIEFSAKFSSEPIDVVLMEVRHDFCCMMHKKTCNFTHYSYDILYMICDI